LKNHLFVISTIVILSIIPVSFSESGNYDLEINEGTFVLPYSFDGEIISMDVDKELPSLLIGTINVNESTFELSFPSELISAENDEFIILLDGAETDYAITHTEDMTNISFVIPIATEEIEIIGTSVIPEFPFGVLAIMGVVSAMAVVFSRTKLVQFR